MEKQLILFGIAVMLIAVGLSGCTENSSSELKVFSLTLDDLPERYIKSDERFSYPGTSFQGIIPTEFYSVTFIYEDSENNTEYPKIKSFLFKFDSPEDASIGMNKNIETTLSSWQLLNRITPQDVEQIGDESVYELYQGSILDYGNQNDTYSIFYFIVQNIYVIVELNTLTVEGALDWNIDFVNLNFNYAKIVENRIDSGLNRI